MSYSPPSGATVDFSLRTGYVIPSGGNVRFSWLPCGDCAATVVLSSTAAGAVGAAGVALVANVVIARGDSYLHPAGVGEARFSMDALATATGFVAEFGGGAAQVRFAKYAAGIVGAFGSASAPSCVLASGIGVGDVVRAAGAVTLPVVASGVAQTSEAIAPVEGVGEARVSFAGAGEGRVSVCGVASAKVRIAGVGQAKRGVVGQGVLVVPIAGAGVARRGVVGSAAESLRLVSTGRAGVGASGAGHGDVGLIGAGSAGFIAPVVGAGRVVLPIVAKAYGERAIDYSDARVDLLFVRTVERSVFVRAA